MLISCDHDHRVSGTGIQSYARNLMNTCAMRTSAGLCMALFAIVLEGQSYSTLLNPTAVWHDERGWGDPGPNTSNSRCVKYYLDGDTIVDGEVYQKLLITGRYSHSNSVNSQLSYTIWYDGDLYALVREDAIERKVFIRTLTGGAEELLYDFSVGTGPYPWTFLFPSDDLEVTVIDTIMLADGPRRRLHLGEYIKIIEGVGCVYGLLPYQTSGIEWMAQLACHKLDGVPTYGGIIADNGCGCDVSVGVEGYSLQWFAFASPNPSEGLFSVTAPSMQPLIVRNAMGREVLHVPHNASIIDLTAYPPGLYTVSVRTQTGQALQRLVVMR